MSICDREKIHYELLEELYMARRQVDALEAALAHNAAYLGTGVEREGQIGRPAPDPAKLPSVLMKYLELVEPGADISDFIGREGHEESRPRLGKDAPEDIRPDKQPVVSPLVGQLTLDHPADGINFGLPRVPVAPVPEDSEELERPATDDPQPLNAPS